VHKADFERLLATRSRVRSAHFAIHHVPGTPERGGERAPNPASAKLSTEPSPALPEHVDNTHWLGCLVPKRQARRAATRNLIKRQMRETFRHQAALLPQGLWLLRLHAGFAVATHPSAASEALASAAGSELRQLLGRCVA
jgi:ribonuclease P protein component